MDEAKTINFRAGTADDFHHGIGADINSWVCRLAADIFPEIVRTSFVGARLNLSASSIVVPKRKGDDCVASREDEFFVITTLFTKYST
jgi:hypothetical protein